MVNTEFSEGITEVLDILNHMEKSYIDKLPKKFKDFLDKNKSNSYIPNLDHSKKIKEMHLKEKTKDILATIYMNYWCNCEQKSNYAKVLKQNEEKYQEELRKKYNPHNLFKNNRIIQETKEEPITENVQMIKYKEENIFQKVLKKIKEFLRV